MLARMALRRGVDIEINWIGRIGVFLVFGGIFWSMVFDWWIIRAGFVFGVALTVAATVVYVRAARGRVPHGTGATVKLKLKFADRAYNRPGNGIWASLGAGPPAETRFDEHRVRRDLPGHGHMSDQELKDLISQLTEEEHETLLPPSRSARQDRHPAR